MSVYIFRWNQDRERHKRNEDDRLAKEQAAKEGREKRLEVGATKDDRLVAAVSAKATSSNKVGSPSRKRPADEGPLKELKLKRTMTALVRVEA
jgi:hypothetical protein